MFEKKNKIFILKLKKLKIANFLEISLKLCYFELIMLIMANFYLKLQVKMFLPIAECSNTLRTPLVYATAHTTQNVRRSWKREETFFSLATRNFFMGYV